MCAPVQHAWHCERVEDHARLQRRGPADTTDIAAPHQLLPCHCQAEPCYLWPPLPCRACPDPFPPVPLHNRVVVPHLLIACKPGKDRRRQGRSDEVPVLLRRQNRHRVLDRTLGAPEPQGLEAAGVQQQRLLHRPHSTGAISQVLLNYTDVLARCAKQLGTPQYASPPHVDRVSALPRQAFG